MAAVGRGRCRARRGSGRGVFGFRAADARVEQKSRFENDTHGGSTHGKIAVIVVCNKQTDAAPGAAKTPGWRWNKTDFSYERALGSSHSHSPPHSPLFIQHTS